MSFKTFGDSISTNATTSGASTAAKSWMGLFSPITAAVSGNGAGDMSKVIQTSHVAEPAKKYAIMIGTNDHRNYKGDATKQEFFKRFLRQSIVWLTCQTLKKARTSSTAVYTGAWSNTAGNSFGKVATATNAKVTETFSGDTLYVGYIIQNDANAASTANVVVDGDVVGTIGCQGAMNTTGGNSFAGACARFSGLGAGAHTVEIVITSSGKNLYYDYVAGSDDIDSAGILLSNVIRMSAAAYASFGSSDAIVDQYNTIIGDLITEFTADGLLITLVDNHASINPLTDLADGVHPNDGGHVKINANFAALL